MKKEAKETNIVWFQLHEAPIAGKFVKARRSRSYQGPGGRETGEGLFNGDGVSVWENEKILEIDSRNCRTTLWMYLMPVKCTLKNG